MVVFERDVASEQQDAARTVVVEEAVPHDDVPCVVGPVEQDEAAVDRLRNRVFEGDLVHPLFRIDGADRFDRGTEAGRGVVAVAEFDRRAGAEGVDEFDVPRRDRVRAGFFGVAGAVVRVQTVVRAEAEFAILHLEESARTRDMAVVGRAGDEPARHSGRRGDVDSPELPVLLEAADHKGVSGAGVNIDVLKRQVAVVAHDEAVHVVVVVLHAEELSPAEGRQVPAADPEHIA